MRLAVLLYPKSDDAFIKIPERIQAKHERAGLAAETYLKGRIVSSGGGFLYMDKGQPKHLGVGDDVWIAPYHGLYCDHRDFPWIEEGCTVVFLKPDDYAEMPDVVLKAS
mgnify:CR=1 FL=1